MSTRSLDKARSAKSRVLAMLGDVPELAGVGITRVKHGYGIKVNLSADPARDVELPAEVDGVPVVFEVVGRIKKRTPPPE